jgi:antitoxin HicB
MAKTTTRLDYPFVVRPLTDDDGGGYLVEVPDLPGCMSDGETPEEAIRNAADAMQCWIAAMRDAGRPVPPAGSARYSGKWQMRVPRSLHRRLAERARDEGVSLNALASTLISEGLGARRAKVARRR